MSATSPFTVTDPSLWVLTSMAPASSPYFAAVSRTVPSVPERFLTAASTVFEITLAGISSPTTAPERRKPRIRCDATTSPSGG